MHNIITSYYDNDMHDTINIIMHMCMPFSYDYAYYYAYVYAY